LLKWFDEKLYIGIDGMRDYFSSEVISLMISPFFVDFDRNISPEKLRKKG